MSVLIIVENTSENLSWINDYLSQVPSIVSAYGGHYITRTNTVELLEGNECPQTTVVAQFPSKEAALSFYHSNEYQPFKDARLTHSTSKMMLVAIENGAE